MKFEYKVRPFSDVMERCEMENFLNDLGKYGWELIHVAKNYIILKRCIQSKDSEEKLN